jgi:hypothetical protein
MNLDPLPWVDTEDGERAPDSRFWPWADFEPRPGYEQDWRKYSKP